MTLHDRIMELPTQDRHLEDWSNTRTAWLAGFDTGLYEAAQIAKEADEVMAVMEKALIDYAWIEDAEGEGASVANEALNAYYKYKERKQ